MYYTQVYWWCHFVEEKCSYTCHGLREQEFRFMQAFKSIDKTFWMWAFVHLFDWCWFQHIGETEGVGLRTNRLSLRSWKQTKRSESRGNNTVDISKSCTYIIRNTGNVTSVCILFGRERQLARDMVLNVWGAHLYSGMWKLETIWTKINFASKTTRIFYVVTDHKVTLYIILMPCWLSFVSVFY
jgi:hypothetical protein